MSEKQELQVYVDNVNMIKAFLVDAAQDFCAVGYYLKQIRDTKQYKQAGFKDIWDMAYAEFGFHKSTASRHMKMNDLYSDGGNSYELDKKYTNFSKSQLQEMMYLPEEQLKEVVPQMPVKEIRELKPEKPKKVQEPVATSQQEKEPEVSHFTVANKKIGIEGAYGTMYAEIVRDYLSLIHEAKIKTIYESPSVTFVTFGSEYTAEAGENKVVFYDSSGKAFMDVECTRLQEEYEYWYPEVSAKPVEEPLSPYGLTKTVYPEDSSLTTVGCGHKYSCFTCAQDCEIRQKDRYCVEAPMGNPFGCNTMNVIENLRSEVGGSCQFINLETAFHSAGSNEPVPCCQECKDPCGYQCRRAVLTQEPQAEKEQPEIIDVEPEEIKHYENPVPEIEEVAIKDVKQYPDSLTYDEIKVLKDHIKDKKEQLEVMGESWKEKKPLTYTKYVTLQTACELMLQHGKPVTERQFDAYDPDLQPELPVLKNMDVKEDFVLGYESWPVWCKNELTEETFYRYNLPDGFAIVVKHYPYTVTWNNEECIGKDLYLLGPNNKHFKNGETSMTVIKEHLKEVQKKK